MLARYLVMIISKKNNTNVQDDNIQELACLWISPINRGLTTAENNNWLLGVNKITIITAAYLRWLFIGVI
ncbi:MAG: hypothetical protein ACI8SC_000888 [Colwellia sp.]|jgi:hypothetical protein